MESSPKPEGGAHTRRWHPELHLGASQNTSSHKNSRGRDPLRRTNPQNSTMRLPENLRRHDRQCNPPAGGARPRGWRPKIHLKASPKTNSPRKATQHATLPGAPALSIRRWDPAVGRLLFLINKRRYRRKPGLRIKTSCKYIPNKTIVPIIAKTTTAASKMKTKAENNNKCQRSRGAQFPRAEVS